LFHLIHQQQNRMWLPPELAMQVGSYLDPHDLRVCTTQLCSSGAGFVANLFTNVATTILLHKLVACCRLSADVEDVAQECIERIESFLARRGNVRTIILDTELKREYAANASVYSDIHRRLQQDSSFQLSRKQGITVEWHAGAYSIAEVEFLLKADMPKDGAGVSDARAGGALRQYVHTLDLWESDVNDLSFLASCKSLHTLNLWFSQVSDVSGLASCPSLHTLDLGQTEVSDVSVLAACQSLHTLVLWQTGVSDVSVLTSCQSLHTLDLSETEVSDVSVLASCKSLHTLNLKDTQVSDVSVLASCQSLHKLKLRHTLVDDVSGLAACQSLHTLSLNDTLVSDVSPLASCQSLHTLKLRGTQVSDVSALASCKSLHTLDLETTDVSDVSALGSSRSLSVLWGVEEMIGGTDVLRIIQGRGN
jgi:Leucine-rich repeat (LRR) protein